MDKKVNIGYTKLPLRVEIPEGEYYESNSIFFILQNDIIKKGKEKDNVEQNEPRP